MPYKQSMLLLAEQALCLPLLELYINVLIRGEAKIFVPKCQLLEDRCFLSPI